MRSATIIAVLMTIGSTSYASADPVLKADKLTLTSRQFDAVALYFANHKYIPQLVAMERWGRDKEWVSRMGDYRKAFYPSSNSGSLLDLVASSHPLVTGAKAIYSGGNALLDYNRGWRDSKAPLNRKLIRDRVVAAFKNHAANGSLNAITAAISEAMGGADIANGEFPLDIEAALAIPGLRDKLFDGETSLKLTESTKKQLEKTIVDKANEVKTQAGDNIVSVGKTNQTNASAGYSDDVDVLQSQHQDQMRTNRKLSRIAEGLIALAEAGGASPDTMRALAISATLVEAHRMAAEYDYYKGMQTAGATLNFDPDVELSMDVVKLCIQLFKVLAKVKSTDQIVMEQLGAIQKQLSTISKQIYELSNIVAEGFKQVQIELSVHKYVLDNINLNTEILLERSVEDPLLALAAQTAARMDSLRALKDTCFVTQQDAASCKPSAFIEHVRAQGVSQAGLDFSNIDTSSPKGFDELIKKLSAGFSADGAGEVSNGAIQSYRKTSSLPYLIRATNLVLAIPAQPLLPEYKEGLAARAELNKLTNFSLNLDLWKESVYLLKALQDKTGVKPGDKVLSAYHEEAKKIVGVFEKTTGQQYFHWLLAREILHSAIELDRQIAGLRASMRNLRSKYSDAERKYLNPNRHVPSMGYIRHCGGGPVPFAPAPDFDSFLDQHPVASHLETALLAEQVKIVQFDFCWYGVAQNTFGIQFNVRLTDLGASLKTEWLHGKKRQQGDKDPRLTEQETPTVGQSYQVLNAYLGSPGFAPPNFNNLSAPEVNQETELELKTLIDLLLHKLLAAHLTKDDPALETSLDASGTDVLAGNPVYRRGLESVTASFNSYRLRYFLYHAWLQMASLYEIAPQKCQLPFLMSDGFIFTDIGVSPDLIIRRLDSGSFLLRSRRQAQIVFSNFFESGKLSCTIPNFPQDIFGAIVDIEAMSQ